ncbi:hypothetical protein RIR_jg29124.t1 [Rhizophagus irregularis DAOM 181602=DAOM 197198]|nr:hypothetical protein RIR_jg29124.t1 [Rhizophagus irregularis DAOM 181602=DAOM 197198]
MLSDEEFNPDQENLEEYDTEEWEGFKEQICSEFSNLDILNTLRSTIWLYFNKNSSYALGYNICKNVHIDIK